MDLAEIVCVLKPAHWEVDARALGVAAVVTQEDRRLPMLSSFLQEKFPREDFPLLHSSEQQFGIIHRLDAPSSGLILAGKNFVGYYTLRWQMDTYELGREYLVLCHGRMPWGPRVIKAKIKTSKEYPASSRVSDEGKPAWTRIEPLCILRREGWRPGRCCSLIVIAIRTGRTHQIRVHLQHIGHPTVTDGKYSDRVVFSEDLRWCARNFLHRFRLTFQDTEGRLREAVAPLPDDLLAVLRGTLPAYDDHDEDDDRRSAFMLQRLQTGWVPSCGVS